MPDHTVFDLCSTDNLRTAWNLGSCVATYIRMYICICTVYAYDQNKKWTITTDLDFFLPQYR